jgi:hypothetical protein
MNIATIGGCAISLTSKGFWISKIACGRTQVISYDILALSVNFVTQASPAISSPQNFPGHLH